MQQHVYTYNPIIGEPRDHSRFSVLAPRDAVEPGTVLVLLREGLGLQAILEPRKLTAAEMMFGGIRRIYRVDVTEHKLEWQSWLHARGDEWVLLAHIQLRCRVSNPIRIVEENVRDAYSVLEPLLAERMRHVVERYSLGARGEAERAVTDDLRKDRNLSEFFELRWVGVRLNLDQTMVAQKKRSLDFSFYVEHLQRGDWAALGLQLAHNPDAINGMVQVILEQRQAQAELQFKALEAYLEKGALEGYQLEGPARELLHRLARTWQAATGAAIAPDSTSSSALPEPPPPFESDNR